MTRLKKWLIAAGVLIIPAVAIASVTVNINGSNYTIPETNEKGWGTQVTSWIQAASQHLLQKTGGAFTLSDEVDFGASFGLKSTYYKSRALNLPETGVFRLGNTEGISWRNAANDGDILFSVNGSDQLVFNGNAFLESDALTASRALQSDANGIISSSSVTSTELGYLSGVTSDLQTQLDAKALDSDLDAHLADTTDAHDASAISVTPSGNQSSSEVQAAIDELQSDIDTRALDSDLDTHTAATTSVHGITDTSDLATLSGEETFSGQKTFSDALILEEIAEPDAPPEGSQAIFIDSADSKPKRKDSDGNVLEFGTGSGGGSEVIFYDDFETGVGNWTAFHNATNFSDGEDTTTTPTITIAETTTTPHEGSKSALITAGAAGDGVSTDIPLERKDRARVQRLTLTFEYDDTAAEGDYEIWFYDDTNSQAQQPTPYKLPGGVAGQVYRFAVPPEVQTNHDCETLRLSIYQKAATPPNLKIDNVSVGPGVRVSGPVVTDSESYTPTVSNLGSGSTDSAIVYYSRIGDKLIGQGKVVKDTTAGTGTSVVTVSLPSGLAIDTNKVPSADFNQNIGSAQLQDGATRTEGVVQINNSTSIGFVMSGTNSLTGSEFGASDQLSFTFTVPIQGWSSNQVLSSDTATREVIGAASLSGDQAVSSTSEVQVELDEVITDTHSQVDTANHRVLVKIPGFYKVKARVQVGAYTANEYFIARIKDSSGTTVGVDISVSASSSVFAKAEVPTKYYNAGEYFEVFAQSDSDTSYSIVASNTFLEIQRVSGPQQIAASTQTYVIASSNSGQVFSKATEATVIYEDVEEISHGTAFYDPTTGIITANRAGFIYVDASVVWPSVDTSVSFDTFMTIRKNGSAYKVGPRLTFLSGHSSVIGVSVTGLVPVQAGDTIDIRAYQSNGSTNSEAIGTGNTTNRFSAHYIGGVQ